jgi:N-acetylglutamate synthase-like GNAT family acetyltransferase
VSESQATPRHDARCVIREAVPEDAPVIEALYRELMADASIRVRSEQVATIAGLPDSYLLVAEMEGAVCATVLLTICPDLMYGAQPFGVLENVVVSDAMRGRGVGRLLLRHAEKLLVAHDGTKLMLHSSVARESAHAFFRRCGFAGDRKLAFVKYRGQFADQ